jgi:hypothetical protein
MIGCACVLKWPVSEMNTSRFTFFMARRVGGAPALRLL